MANDRLNEFVDCPLCEGDGQVLDRRRITSRSPEPPMKRCPGCNGSGSVDVETAERLSGMTVDECEMDRAIDEAEHRWEQDMDR